MAAPRHSSTDKRLRQRRERRGEFAATVPKPLKAAVGRSTTIDTPLHVRDLAGTLDDATRAYVRQRAGFKLGKFGLHLTRVSVRFERGTGPATAPMYACRLKAVLPRTSEVVVSASARTARAAFDTAIDAAERAVRRLLDRSRA